MIDKPDSCEAEWSSWSRCRNDLDKWRSRGPRSSRKTACCRSCRCHRHHHRCCCCDMCWSWGYFGCQTRQRFEQPTPVWNQVFPVCCCRIRCRSPTTRRWPMLESLLTSSLASEGVKDRFECCSDCNGAVEGEGDLTRLGEEPVVLAVDSCGRKYFYILISRFTYKYLQ